MRHLKRYLYLTTMLCLLAVDAATAQDTALTERYNSKRPVTIACDWDKPPYEFLNNNGQPAGSNIDIMRTIMRELKLPCRFIMKEWGNAIKTFERGEADLILANVQRYRMPPYITSHNIINYNRIKVAVRRSDSIANVTQRMLEEGHAVFKPSDYAAKFFIEEDSMRASRIEFQSPKAALTGLVAGDNKYFVWGEAALKWKIKELNLDDIVLCSVSIPISEIHVIGRDRELIDQIDDHYSRLKQSGEVERIHNRWFHPERMEDTTPPYTIYATIAGLLTVMLFYLLYHLAKERVRKDTADAADLNSIMTKALHMGSDAATEDNKRSGYHDLKHKYDSLFNTPMMAMAIYDKDGWPLAINEPMKQLCGYDNSDNERYWNSLCMFDIPLFRTAYTKDDRDDLIVCQHMEYPEMGIDRYLEFHVHPVTNSRDEVTNYICSAIDITDEHERVHQIYEQEHRIRRANEQINKYERQLQYLLERGNMYVWRSDEASRMLHFTRSLRHTEFSETYDEYLARMSDEERRKTVEYWNATTASNQMQRMTQHFTRRRNGDGEQWCLSVGFPITDADGRVSGHFGLLRDITDLMKAQQQLRQETARAEDSGRQKSMFLASMTHEIRTPLNSIVGFSDLLGTVDTPEERHEFIRIIRTNCDMLLRLINDILEASSINDGPQSIEPTDVDFAKAFDDIFQTLGQRVQTPGVSFIKDNPYTSYPTRLDIGRIQQVITNFVINAVKYTKEGHVKIGYREEHSGGTDMLYIYCEDTGAGIPKDKQASVFERFVKLNEFVQGTGLGLAICKSIAERSGGTIGVSSEGKGHGSTFWIRIPCIKKP